MATTATRGRACRSRFPCTLVRGGNQYELLRPVRPDDRLSVRWRIEEITERQGRSGPMLVLVARAEYRNQQRELLATNLDTTIFLPAPDRGS